MLIAHLLSLLYPGFLRIKTAWTTLDYWSRVCKISSYFPSEWVQHLICSMDEWTEHHSEMQDKINDFLVADINQQMIDRGMKNLHFLDNDGKE